MTHPVPPDFPGNPRDFLAQWSAGRGNLRNFLETTAAAPLDESAQQTAGVAAAAAAVREVFGLEFEDFTHGMESVSGSIRAAGSLKVSPTDPTITQQPGVAAFFDVDNTLIRGSSLVAFAMGLAREKFFGLPEVLSMGWKQLRYRVTGAENAEDVAKGRETALAMIKGHPVDEVVALCQRVVDDYMAARAFPGTREVAEAHIAAGQQVWLVSATPVQLAQILARRFGFTGALGTVAEVDNGVFTGRLSGDILHGPGKRHAVAALAALEKLDLKRCTAYSDSINDLPMLSMVGTPVAVNPDRQLRAEAQRRGWQILDYRSIRKAIRAYGLPSLLTAAGSLIGWRLRRRFGQPGR